MRNAVGQMNQMRLDRGEAFGFEPLRGPATVTRLPLNPAPLASQTVGGARAAVHELRAAMTLAGLDGR